jgi:DNA polymerase-3 subunit epsilon
MGFIALDVETANADMASICQIGLATFDDSGLITHETSLLINPEDYFDFMNVHVHGIDESTVENSPKFPQVYDQVKNMLEDSITVCHTSFDRNSLSRVCDKYGLPLIETTWLDSAQAVRWVWDEYSRSGYGLKNMAQVIGYEFKHHDALEDAKASGHILLATIEKSETNLTEWVEYIGRPSDHSPSQGKTRRNPFKHYESVHKMDGNPDGELFGEVIVFTGTLTIPRNDAARIAVEAGCTVTSSVSKKTTLLVVGDQDVSKLAGHKKSSKHRKAEELITNGQGIRILKESDFKKLLHL